MSNRRKKVNRKNPTVTKADLVVELKSRDEAIDQILSDNNRASKKIVELEKDAAKDQKEIDFLKGRIDSVRDYEQSLREMVSYDLKDCQKQLALACGVVMVMLTIGLVLMAL